MFEEVGNIIRSRYATAFPAIPTQYDNGPPCVTTGLWVRLTILWGSVQATEINGNMRLVGVVSMQMRQPFITGEQALLQLGDQIADVFRSIQVQNVTFRTPSVESFGRDGAYWLMNVSCPFFADEVA